MIGLDASGRIELPNRAANELLGLDLMAAIGRELADVVPEFADLLHEAAASPERARTAEIQIGPPTRRRTLLVRIGADLSGGRTDGFVVTFDDITELQSAQRKAAWADVARRIAHEIKNPLTPIQLAAERLKRRLPARSRRTPTRSASAPIRSSGMSATSAGWSMNSPVSRACRNRSSSPRMSAASRARLWSCSGPRGRRSPGGANSERGPVVPCDRRLLSQALTNLLQNAADAAMRECRGNRASPPHQRRYAGDWSTPGSTACGRTAPPAPARELAPPGDLRPRGPLQDQRLARDAADILGLMTGCGIRAKLENSSTIRPMSPTCRMIVSAH